MTHGELYNAVQGFGTSIRAAASAEFPRQFPVPEGEQLLAFRIHRLGLKARW